MSHEMPLINCKINLILTWSTDCIVSAAIEARKLAITNTKTYTPVVTVLTQNNRKLLQDSNN